jgi:hypothetical protein
LSSWQTPSTSWLEKVPHVKTGSADANNWGSRYNGPSGQ